jgi:Na+-driven multidrug efflux pump
MYKEMFRGGFPSLIRQGLMSLAAIIIMHFARAYGDAAIAAISIVQRLCMFANSAVLGFGQGFQPVCGFNYGAKLYSRVRKAYSFCARSCSIGLVFVSLAMAVFAPQLIALFRDEPEVIAIGVRGLRLNCIGLPFLALVTISNMMTQTMGKALQASIIAFTRQGFFLIPLLFILSPTMGLLGTQLATPAADLASVLVVIPITVKVVKSISIPDGT